MKHDGGIANYPRTKVSSKYVRILSQKSIKVVKFHLSNDRHSCRGERPNVAVGLNLPRDTWLSQILHARDHGPIPAPGRSNHAVGARLDRPMVRETGRPGLC